MLYKLRNYRERTDLYARSHVRGSTWFFVCSLPDGWDANDLDDAKASFEAFVRGYDSLDDALMAWIVRND